jgi:alkaline phosphatase D
MPARRVAVSWRVATDIHMRHIVQRGEVWALPERGHAVHVRPHGLDSDRWYYYQFFCAGQSSPIGRTRTFPSRFDRTQHLRFALASCQDYQAGFFSAYRHMAEQDLDFVVHVGDYIYEYGTQSGAVREVPDGETQDLEGYRRRYALYRLDPDLQAAHAAFPFLVTFDDHEVENNYAGSISEDGAELSARKAAAYQAYFENMPLAFKAYPRGPEMRLFRRFNYGNLASIHMLDTRQYRSDQPCGDGLQAACEDTFDPEATLMGDTQESWLKRNLSRSTARWNVLAQQIMMTRWDLSAGLGAPVPFFNMDAWDGYPAARDRILSFIAQHRVRNTIVLSGDIHSAWQADLKVDFTDPKSKIVATEFVGTSITSEFPAAYIPLVEATLPSNPHINFFDGFHRGYMIHEVSHRSWRAEYFGVADPLDRNSEVDFLAAFRVLDGVPGAVTA